MDFGSLRVSGQGDTKTVLFCSNASIKRPLPRQPGGAKGPRWVRGLPDLLHQRFVSGPLDSCQIAISGQSVPILRCVKYCTLRGRSGYIFTNPILRDRTRMPALICASATHDGFQVSEAAMSVTLADTRHSSLSNGRSALKQEVKSFCLKVRNPAEK